MSTAYESFYSPETYFKFRHSLIHLIWKFQVFSDDILKILVPYVLYHHFDYDNAAITVFATILMNKVLKIWQRKKIF